MGLKNFDIENWLTLDRQYPVYHKIRSKLLDTNKDEVLQAMPSAKSACAELLEVVVQYLLKQYPHHFSKRRNDEGKICIFNLTNKEHFYLDPPDHRFGPLEICARLTMDDFNILMKDSEGQHHLWVPPPPSLKVIVLIVCDGNSVASATLFPAAWRLLAHFGWTITELHTNVPLWSLNNSGPVERYFSRLNERSLIERSAYFIQIAPPAAEVLSLRTLFIQTPEQMFAFEGGLGILRPQDVIVRRERQTFTRLERSEAVCFTVRTTMTRLIELKDEDYRGMAMGIRAWPEDVAEYRGVSVWGDVVLRYCDERVAGSIGNIE
jgi:hypothetical protein